MNTSRKTPFAAHAAAGKQAERGPRTRHTLALVAICLGYFMVILDTTIVNVALLDIQHRLTASTTELQWIVDGYTLAFASLLLTAGALGDRLGSRRMFLSGLALFSITSALCGAAPTLGMLQAARVAQGIGAALLVPTSLSLLSQTFPDAESRARAIGIWGSLGGVGAVAGPVLGGLLVSLLSWRSVFLVNVPVGAFAFVLALRAVSPSPRAATRGLDLAAQVMAVLALSGLTFASIEGGVLGWPSPPIVGAFALSGIAALAFLVIEMRVKSPMLPLALFTRPTFSAANAIGLLLNFGFYGQLFCISLFFQQVRGYSPLLTGLALLPEATMVLAASPLSGRISGRVGPRVPMIAGLAVGGVGFLAMILVSEATPYLVLCFMLAAIGFGTSFTMPAMTTAVIASAPRDRSGIASAVLNAGRQVGSVLGVAVLGTLVNRRSIFVTGLHSAMLLAGSAFLVGCLLTVVFVQRGQINGE